VKSSNQTPFFYHGCWRFAPFYFGGIMLVMKDLVSDEYLSKKYPIRGSFVVQGKKIVT